MFSRCTPTVRPGRSLRRKSAALLAGVGALGLVLSSLTVGGSAMAQSVDDDGVEPTIVIFELYYEGQDYDKTPAYASKIATRIVKEGGFSVVSRQDSEKIIFKAFPQSTADLRSDEAASIQKMVTDAEELFFKEGPEAALGKLREADTRLKRLVSAMSLTEELRKQFVSTQMLLALVYLRDGSAEEAEKVMEAVVRQVGDDDSINTDNYHPDAVSLFRDVYNRLATKRVGKITVRTSPPGAEVYINGMKQDRKTPATYEGLYPGEVILQVQKDGKKSRVRRVSVSSGTEEAFEIDLNFEASLAFSKHRFGLTFQNEVDMKRNLPAFAARLAEMVDADYTAFIGLGDSEGRTNLEGYLIHAETDKQIRKSKMFTRANVVSKNRVVQMARFLLYGENPEIAYKPWYANTLGWVLTGTAVAGGVVGGIMYSGYSDNKAIAECDPGADLAASGCEPQRDRLEAKDSAEGQRTAAYVSWGVAAAALVGGVVAFIVIDEEDPDAPVRPKVPGSKVKMTYISPTVTPDGGVGVGAGFSF